MARRADRRSKRMKRDAVLQQCPVFIKTQHVLKVLIKHVRPTALLTKHVGADDNTDFIAFGSVFGGPFFVKRAVRADIV